MVQVTSPDAPHGHVVLAGADSAAFTSLRQPSTARSDRYRIGKELRRRVPRRALGDWSPPAGRPDPVRLIMESHLGRLHRLGPARGGGGGAPPPRVPGGAAPRLGA